MLPFAWSYQIALTIFVPLAVGAVFTFLSQQLAAANASKKAKTDIELQARNKLADYRQAWLDDLRDTISRLQARALVNDEETRRLLFRVLLLMNREDTRYTEFKGLVASMLGRNTDGESRSDTLMRLTNLSQDILKTEWEVLKADLRYKKIMPEGSLGKRSR